MKASLRRRLLVLSLAALVPGLAVAAFTQYQVIRSRHVEVEELAMRSAKQASFELDRIVGGVGMLLVTASHEPDVRGLQEAGCTAYLTGLRPDLPYLTGLTVLDTDGRLRCGFTPSTIGHSFTDRSYFREALETDGLVIGSYTIGAVSKKPVLPIALAMRNDSGAVQGVIVAALDLAWLGEKLKERGVPPGGSLTISDRNGVIIAREPSSDKFVGTKIPEQYLGLLTAAHPGWEDVSSQDGTRRVLGYVPVTESPKGLYVSAGLSAASSYEAVNVAARIGVALAATGAIATLLATWVMGNRVFVAPVRDVTAILRRWRAGDRTARTNYAAASGELGELGSELDRLMDEIASSEEQRRLLASELEHRVKNTLTTVQALAVSTMNRTPPGKELLPDFMARIKALAGAHAVLTREQWDNADLRALLRDVIGTLVGEVDDKVRFDGPDIDLQPDAALGMTMVIHELSTNALKYGALGSPEGRVDLSWRVHDVASGSLLRMEWRESGGPPVVDPAGKTGFGTRMIGRALAGFGTTAVEFAPAGLICRIELILSVLGKRAA
jgi:two-component sensor histidine kinase